MDTSPTVRSARRTGRGAGDWTVATYAVRVRRTAARIAGSRHGSFDADDIAQRVVERFLRNCDALMAKYPNPDIFAAVNTRGERIDFSRREQVQRCQGVDGGHDVISWDQAIDAGWDGRPSHHDTAAEAIGGITAGQYLAGLDERDRHIADAHWVRGDKVGEIASDLSLNHGTVSRRLRAIATVVRDASRADGYVLVT